MASAYTPGLTVSEDIIVRRLRRLPIKGDVLVKIGDKVNPTDIVARALLPGLLQTIKLSEKLGVEAAEVKTLFRLQEGDPIEKGQLIAETKGLWGLFKQSLESEFTGTVESISPVTGNILVREPAIPVAITAYMQGAVADTLPEEGVFVETRGAMVQGIFGVGGERVGKIRVASESASNALTAADVKADDTGNILVTGGMITAESLARAAEVGAVGIIGGGVRDADLVEYLGYDIGVAITGQEPVPVTLMVTEGFGALHMPDRTFNLLKKMGGKMASMNGATQIRAGVIRPEIIVPLEIEGGSTHVAASGGELKAGTSVRIIREPYFGQIGVVTQLPAQLQVVESGTEVRVLIAKLSSGDEVCVPRANVEIIAT